MPAKSKKVFDPAEFFALQDIALWTTALTREVDFEIAVHKGRCAVQTRHHVEPRLMHAVMEGEEEAKALLRVLVTLGLRSVFTSDEEASDGKDQVLYTLEACFAVDYEVKETPAEEDFFKFLERNCLHQAWPFWRQHVYDTLKRASLPVPVIPLMSGALGDIKRKRVRRIMQHNESSSPLA